MSSVPKKAKAPKAKEEAKAKPAAKAEVAAATPKTAPQAPSSSAPKAKTDSTQNGEAASKAKEQIGEVVSNKMQKTIVVKVVRRVAHRKFKKIVKVSSKFYAHDEQSEAKAGDLVKIRETRPLSKLKRWELVSVLKH